MPSDISQALEPDAIADSLLSDHDQAQLQEDQGAPSQDDTALADLHTDREDWQGHKLTPGEEARAEFQAEQTAQFVAQEEAEAPQAEYEEDFQAALDNYDKLPAEERAEVCQELAGRGYAQVNAERALRAKIGLLKGGLLHTNQ